MELGHAKSRHLGQRYPCIEPGCERWFKLTNFRQKRCRPCQALHRSDAASPPQVVAASLATVKEVVAEGGLPQAQAKVELAARKVYADVYGGCSFSGPLPGWGK